MPTPKRKREGPKKTTGGNNRADREWMAETLESGDTIEINPADKPKDVVDDVKYQFQGHGDEVDPDFFNFYWRWPNSPRRCNATAYVRDERGGYVLDIEWERIRRPCLAPPIPGGEVCRHHGGSVPAVKAAAQRTLANAAEVVALRLVGLTATTDEDGAVIEHKVRLAAMNSVLDRAGIKGNIEVEVTVPGYKRIMSGMFGAEPDDAED